MKRSRNAALMRGFSLLEVMIALLVLAFGLLGLALLQTMNLRYTQAANQRTQAVNLAGELMDMMRSNRTEIGRYALPEQNLSSVGVPPGGCGTFAALGADTNLARWTCQAREALGEDAVVEIKTNAATGVVSVDIGWNEGHLEQSSNGNVLAGSGKISMETRL